MPKLNRINEEERQAFIRAIDDPRVFCKVVMAVAYAGVKTKDRELDGLVSGMDDGGGEEDLSSAYNEGFQQACEDMGLTSTEVLDSMSTWG